MSPYCVTKPQWDNPKHYHLHSRSILLTWLLLSAIGTASTWHLTIPPQRIGPQSIHHRKSIQKKCCTQGHASVNVKRSTSTQHQKISNFAPALTSAAHALQRRFISWYSWNTVEVRIWMNNHMLLKVCKLLLVILWLGCFPWPLLLTWFNSNPGM